MTDHTSAAIARQLGDTRLYLCWAITETDHARRTDVIQAGSVDEAWALYKPIVAEAVGAAYALVIFAPLIESLEHRVLERGHLQQRTYQP